MAKTVLVVDEQVVSRRMLQFAMELQGYRVVVADDVPKACGVLSCGGIDLLIVGFNGIENANSEMISLLRETAGAGEVPILMIGDSRVRIRREFREIGSCAWLNRPFRMSDIHGTVESLLASAPLPTLPQSAAANGHERV